MDPRTGQINARAARRDNAKHAESRGMERAIKYEEHQKQQQRVTERMFGQDRQKARDTIGKRKETNL